MKSGFKAGPIVVVEDVTIALIVWLRRVVRIEDCIREAAGVSHDRNRAVSQADELGEAARFVFAGNEDYIGAGVNQVGQFFVVTDFEVAIRMIVESAF